MAVAGIVLAPGTMQKLGPALFVVPVLAGAQRWLRRWHNIVVLIVLVVLLIPMRRYTLPSSLPFQLEPYRVVMAAVAVAWLTSLVIDRRLHIRRTGLERPLGLFASVALVSLFLNPGRIGEVSGTLVKTLMFWVTYFAIVYVLPSVLRPRRDVDLICKTLVTGGAFVALTSVVESRTHYNLFNHLTTVMPFLHLGDIPLTTTDLTGASRGGKPRAYASAQHPIALGAALAMLLPLAVYLARKTGQRRWWLAAALMLFGLFATVSRTGFLILIVIGFVLYRLRKHELKRFWPALIPAVALIHFAVPGTFGTMIQSFFPKGGLIAQQTNQNVGSGRLATLEPALRTEFYPNPLFGEGFGTRISGDNGAVKSNAPILDDEWAGVLMETGLAGVFAFAWIIVRSVRMLNRAARARPGPDGWLPAALSASIAGYGVGMLTFDAFSFIQVTFLFFLLLGLVGCLYADGDLTAPEAARSPAASRGRRIPRLSN